MIGLSHKCKLCWLLNFVVLLWLLKCQNIANFVNMTLKSFLLKRKLKLSRHIQLLFQKSITVWIIQHRNIGNIYSTGVAMGTDLFFLKLSWNTQLIAFWSITWYLLNGILLNLQQIMLSERTFTHFVKYSIYLIFTSTEVRRICFRFRLSVCLSV